MDQRKQREIARKGGQAAHQKGTAHEFTSDEARAAGRKGGEIVSANRAHMSAIGRKGGESSHSGNKVRTAATPETKPVESPIEESADAGRNDHASNGESANGESAKVGAASDESVNDEAGQSKAQSLKTSGNGHAGERSNEDDSVNPGRE